MARLVPLRQGALEALDGKGPFTQNIHLKLEVYVGKKNSSNVGDLDNVISGICDGLMSRHPRASLYSRWNDPLYDDIHPDRFFAIEDDGEVVSIEAVKLTGESDTRWYRVTLSGERAD